MTAILPAPDLYQDWKDWANSLVQKADELAIGGNGSGSGSTPIFDSSGRIIVDLDGLHIFDTTGVEVVAANIVQIDTAHLVDAAIVTSKIANLAVDNAKLAALAVDAAKLADSAVTATKIANLAVGSAAIAAAAVGTAKIANAAITSALIGDLQVVEAKIADLAVTNAKIFDLAVQKLTAGTIAVAGIFLGSARFEMNGISEQIIIKDNQGTPGTRVLLGKLGAGTTDYGIQVFDPSGGLVFGQETVAGEIRNDVLQGLLNPEFEGGDIGWTQSGGDAGDWTVVEDAGNARTGSWCGRLDVGGSNSFFDNTQELQVAPGDRILAQAYCKRTGGTGGIRIVIYWFDSLASSISSSLGNEVTSSSYTQSRVVAAAPALAVSCRFRFLQSTAVGTSGYVDGAYISIVPKDSDIDALATTNAPAAAGADVTANNSQSPSWLTSPVIWGSNHLTAANITSFMDAGTIQNAQLGTDSVSSAKIQDAAITNALLANLAVDAAKLASNAVTEAKLNSGAVTATKIGAAAVGTAAIQNAAITNALIGNLAVNQAKIASASVGTAELIDANVTTAKIANLAVTTALIDTAAVTNAKIGNLAVDTAQIANAAIETAKISDLNITTLKIADQAVTIPSGAFTSGEITNTFPDAATVIQTVTFTATGQPVHISASWTFNSNTQHNKTFQLKRDSTVLLAWSTATSDTEDRLESFAYQDTLATPGSRTYTITMKISGSTVTAKDRSLLTVELKK